MNLKNRKNRKARRLFYNRRQTKGKKAILELHPEDIGILSEILITCNIRVLDQLVDVPMFFLCYSDKINSIDLLNNIKIIRQNAFDSSAIETITLSRNLQYIDKEAFFRCHRLSTIELPENLRYIGQRAFRHCGIHNVTIPSNIKILSDEVFRESDLESVALDEGIEYIGYSTFSGCSNLTTVKLPESLTEINIGAFNHCDNLKEIIYAGTKEQWKKIHIKNYNDPLLQARVVYQK